MELRRQTMAHKAKIGDVFRVSLGNEQFAFGQIVANSKPKCYIVFNYKSSNLPDIKEIVNSKILMLTYTVDTFIEDGDWEVIGNIKPPAIKFPEYVVETEKGTRVVDYNGKVIRKATIEDEQKLSTHKSVSPKVLDLAIKAKFGIGEWYPMMEILLYKE